jgi:hypothetical protein
VFHEEMLSSLGLNEQAVKNHIYKIVSDTGLRPAKVSLCTFVSEPPGSSLGIHFQFHVDKEAINRFRELDDVMENVYARHNMNFFTKITGIKFNDDIIALIEEKLKPLQEAMESYNFDKEVETWLEDK